MMMSEYHVYNCDWSVEICIDGDPDDLSPHEWSEVLDLSWDDYGSDQLVSVAEGIEWHRSDSDDEPMHYVVVIDPPDPECHEYQTHEWIERYRCDEVIATCSGCGLVRTDIPSDDHELHNDAVIRTYRDSAGKVMDASRSE